MSTREPLQNQVKIFRQARGWSQDELARRAGISRTEVSAIEIRRLVPSVATALTLAAALECRVDDLFALAKAEPPADEWAWEPSQDPCRFWRAEIGRRHLLYPAESGSVGVVAHDGVLSRGQLQPQNAQNASDTLVMACCDPAVGLLVRELAATLRVRLLVLKRSSSEALRLLAAGLVHLAGVHLASAEQSGGNAAIIRERLGTGYRLLKMARWEEGLALGPGSGITTVQGAVEGRSSKQNWVGREVGSGARQCLDELFDGRPAPKKIARDHAGVAEAIRCGWADVGVCLKLTAEEAGLEFLSVRQESYDICYRAEFEPDPRFQALLTVCRSPSFRKLLGELPGYEVAHTGELEVIA
ncbi:MAG: substrate-binding domain-containing protein [Planctomycetota bacterium]